MEWIPGCQDCDSLSMYFLHGKNYLCASLSYVKVLSMNKLVCLFGLVVLSAFNAHADILNAPFVPESDRRFDMIERPESSDLIGTVKGEATHTGSRFVQHEAKAIITLGNVAAAKSTGIVLPANSIIQQAFWFLSASGTIGSGSTLAFQCDAANDIYSATNISSGFSVNQITAGVETGTAATMHYSPNGCTVKYVVGTANDSGTIVDLFIDYLVAK